MDIGVGGAGEVEVDDMFDIGDIESSCRYVGSDENTIGRRFESGIRMTTFVTIQDMLTCRGSSIAAFVAAGNEEGRLAFEAFQTAG
jgi:hypothetical protein